MGEIWVITANIENISVLLGNPVPHKVGLPSVDQLILGYNIFLSERMGDAAIREDTFTLSMVVEELLGNISVT